MTICMPDTREILTILGAIIGDKKLIRPSGEPWDLGKAAVGTHVTYLCDADDEKLGAVVTDLVATVYLGGKLVMMPDAAMADKVRARHVDETMLEALEEVVNMTRSVFNGVAGNVHLHATPPSPLEKPRPDGGDVWLLEPAERLDLGGECSFGALRIAMLFR
ncbi:hypothetical protein H8E07_07970 [bacterium]|nr:hypothetical protein [bacterium]